MFPTSYIETISIFTPPIVSNFSYLNTYLSVFLLHFHLVSLLVLLYIQHIYVFQPDDFLNIDLTVMRRKSIVWKVFLTCLFLTLSILFPMTETPLAYQMLTKGAIYDR